MVAKAKRVPHETSRPFPRVAGALNTTLQLSLDPRGGGLQGWGDRVRGGRMARRCWCGPPSLFWSSISRNCNEVCGCAAVLAGRRRL